MRCERKVEEAPLHRVSEHTVPPVRAQRIHVGCESGWSTYERVCVQANTSVTVYVYESKVRG